MGRKEYVRIIKVDTKSKTVDMSKKKVDSTHHAAHVIQVSQSDKDAAKKQHSKSTTVREIVSAVATSCGVSAAELFVKVVWPLNRSHGHAYDAFRMALSDSSVLDELGLTRGVRDTLYELIRDAMSQALSKVFSSTYS